MLNPGPQHHPHHQPQAVVCESPERTAALGADIARRLRPGDVVLIDGPLGAGKTTLARAIAQALGVQPALIASPTFVIAHRYPTPAGFDVAHIDAYRLQGRGSEELEDLGWDRLVGPAANTIALIEWAQRLSGRFDDAHADPEPLRPIRVLITPVGPEARQIEILWPSNPTAPPTAHAPPAQPQPPAPAAATARGPTTCPVTGRPVPADAPTWPFADERARMADLHRWFSGGYTISRPVERNDIEEVE